MYKRAILFLAAAIGMTVPDSAQSIPQEDDEIVKSFQTITYPNGLRAYALSIGPKIGVNYSTVGDPDLGISGNVGFSGGMGANIRFGRPAGKPFGTERFGVQVEALYSMRSLKLSEENINIDCLDIPVLFQWYLHPTFAVEVGPTFTGCGSKAVTENDVMLSVGINSKLRNGFTADLRYNLGIGDSYLFETRVSTISLGIGWLFNVIK